MARPLHREQASYGRDDRNGALWLAAAPRCRAVANRGTCRNGDGFASCWTERRTYRNGEL